MSIPGVNLDPRMPVFRPLAFSFEQLGGSRTGRTRRVLFTLCRVDPRRGIIPQQFSRGCKHKTGCMASRLEERDIT